MHMRFVVSELDRRTGVERGIFNSVWDIDEGDIWAPAWVRRELDRELREFWAYFWSPERFCRRSGRHGWIHGVCWFRSQAGEAVSRARYLSLLLEEAGVPVREVRTKHPGEIIWSNRHQVVARPTRAHPRAFH